MACFQSSSNTTADAIESLVVSKRLSVYSNGILERITPDVTKAAKKLGEADVKRRRVPGEIRKMNSRPHSRSSTRSGLSNSRPLSRSSGSLSSAAALSLSPASGTSSPLAFSRREADSAAPPSLRSSASLPALEKVRSRGASKESASTTATERDLGFLLDPAQPKPAWMQGPVMAMYMDPRHLRSLAEQRQPQRTTATERDLGFLLDPAQPKPAWMQGPVMAMYMNPRHLRSLAEQRQLQRRD